MCRRSRERISESRVHQSIERQSQSTYDDIAEHLAVSEVEAAVGISLQLDVFDRMFSAISAPIGYICSLDV